MFSQVLFDSQSAGWFFKRSQRLHVTKPHLTQHLNDLTKPVPVSRFAAKAQTRHRPHSVSKEQKWQELWPPTGLYLSLLGLGTGSDRRLTALTESGSDWKLLSELLEIAFWKMKLYFTSHTVQHGVLKFLVVFYMILIGHGARQKRFSNCLLFSFFWKLWWPKSEGFGSKISKNRKISKVFVKRYCYNNTFIFYKITVFIIFPVEVFSEKLNFRKSDLWSLL